MMEHVIEQYPEVVHILQCSKNLCFGSAGSGYICVHKESLCNAKGHAEGQEARTKCSHDNSGKDGA